jgi:hypothetical protein
MESRALREQVYTANPSLSWHVLVTWTSGNVSARDPENDLTVAKPSGTGGERTGRGIVDEFGPSSAIPCPHGVLSLGSSTCGLSITQAIKAAVMVEDTPRTVTSVLLTSVNNFVSGTEAHADYDRHDSRYGSAVASQGGHR